MSLKDKLYNTEALPPVNAWGRIAAALDESHDSDKFPTTLYDLEIAPPSAAWDQIATSLNEQSASAAYPSRLYDLEIAPPFNSWDKILSELDPVQQGTSTKRVIPTFLRYAAAAMFIGFAALAIIRFTAGKNKADLRDESKLTIRSEQSASNSIAGSATGATNKMGSVKDDTIAISTRVASNDKPVKKYKTIAIYSDGKTRPTPQIVTENSAANQVYAYQGLAPKIADRYFMLLTPNGNFIRMSKKWGSLLCCVSGEEQDPDCKNQLQKWQEKIADSPITPGPGNFLDILSLVSSLNEGL